MFINGKALLYDDSNLRAEINNAVVDVASGKFSPFFVYYGLVSASTSKDEILPLLRQYKKLGYSIKLAKKRLNKLYPYYFLLSGPFNTRKDAESLSPSSLKYVIYVEKTSSNNTILVKINNEKLFFKKRILIRLGNALTLRDIEFAKGFQYSSRQNVSLRGDVEIVYDDTGYLLLINILPLESYVQGVVASEMGQYFPLEALKAQAVAARTNAIRKLYYNSKYIGMPYNTDNDVYDQVFQGMGRVNLNIKKAVQETRGEIITYNGKPIEALFHSMCGGHTENSENVWSSYIPYLRGVLDINAQKNRFPLNSESAVRKWINSNPPVNCRDKTSKYWRWKFKYKPSELSLIIKAKTGKDLGNILNLVVLKRGVSGRAKLIEIIGTKGSFKIRKDLNIRRALSYSTLPSSLFYITKKSGYFIIKGRGNGHGVGMCQFGARGMALKGYNYKTIIHHYYTGVKIEKIY